MIFKNAVGSLSEISKLSKPKRKYCNWSQMMKVEQYSEILEYYLNAELSKSGLLSVFTFVVKVLYFFFFIK